MWVSITSISNQGFVGELDNDPAYIKDLKYQEKIEFQEKHIIDTDLADPVPSIVEKYIKRCFVTNNILYEGVSVGYLYREDPDQEDDSGWRFTTGTETDEYMDNPDNSSYVSVGAVLSQDDSFIDLLESPSGIAFVKNNEGGFVEVQ